MNNDPKREWRNRKNNFGGAEKILAYLGVKQIF
jgi:hypothetical protein